MVLKKDTLNQLFFTVYTAIKASYGDSIFAELIPSDSSVLDTAQKRVSIFSDLTYTGIITTIKNLCRIPVSEDPVQATSLATITDTTTITLLATAMVDLAIAHNSSAGNASEEDHGIFTDHIQFFDDVVRNLGEC